MKPTKIQADFFLETLSKTRGQIPKALIEKYNFPMGKREIIFSDRFVLQFKEFFKELNNISFQKTMEEFADIYIENHRKKITDPTSPRPDIVISFSMMVTNKKFLDEIIEIRKDFSIPTMGINLGNGIWDEEPFEKGSPVEKYFRKKTAVAIEKYKTFINKLEHDLKFFDYAAGVAEISSPLFHLEKRVEKLLQSYGYSSPWKQIVLFFVITERWIFRFFPEKIDTLIDSSLKINPSINITQAVLILHKAGMNATDIAEKIYGAKSERKNAANIRTIISRTKRGNLKKPLLFSD